MPGKDDKIVIEGIELFTDRLLDLLVTSTFKIGTPNAPVKEGITAEYTIRRADKAYSSRSMTRSMQHFESEGTKGDAISLFQQNIRLSPDQWRFQIEHSGNRFVGVHMNIIGMNCQRHRVNGADCINCSNVVDMSMCVEDIFGGEFQILNMFNDAVRFVAGVDYNRFECLRTGIQVTILLKCTDRHTGDNRCLFLLRIGHTLHYPFPGLTEIDIVLHYNTALSGRKEI